MEAMRLVNPMSVFQFIDKLNAAGIPAAREPKLKTELLPDENGVLQETEVQYSDKLSTTEQLIHRNQRLCDAIVKTAMAFYGVGQKELDQYIKTAEGKGEVAERVSVIQALKHYVRDWSADGEHERRTFPCILETVRKLSTEPPRENGGRFRVLLPGAGLGRLGYEIDRTGAKSVVKYKFAFQWCERQVRDPVFLSQR